MLQLFKFRLTLSFILLSALLLSLFLYWLFSNSAEALNNEVKKMRDRDSGEIIEMLKREGNDIKN